MNSLLFRTFSAVKKTFDEFEKYLNINIAN